MTAAPVRSYVTLRHASTGSPTAHPEPARLGGLGGTGHDRLHDASGLHSLEREQLEERRALDVGPAHVIADRGGQPHRDQRERLAVGQVQPQDAQDLGVGGQTQGLRDLGRRGLEPELQHPALGTSARGLERGLDRGHPTQRLADRVREHEPPGAAPAGDEALVPQQLERAPHRDPGDPVALAQLGLARQRAGRPRGDVVPQLGSKVQVPHDLYCTCIGPANASTSGAVPASAHRRR